MSNELPKAPSLEKRGRLLAVGSVAYDSIITPFGKKDKLLGGSATYFSLASSLFAPTSIVGVVGSDFKNFGVYKKHGIDTSGLEKAPGKTFHWAGKYRFDMNTRDTLKTSLGVFAGFQPRLNDQQKNSRYVFLGNIHPGLQLDVLKQIEQPKFVGLDTMNLWIETARKDLLKVIKKIDLLVINDSEARQLSGEHNLLKAARKILKMMRRARGAPSYKEGAPLPTLIIKQGEHGLLMFNRGMIFNLPGYPLEDVTDPTGAGDSFAGALMGYLAKTDDLSLKNFKKACAVASTVASFTVEDFGILSLEKLTLKNTSSRLALYKNLINF